MTVRTVLVVDDNRINAKLLRLTLEAHGCLVRVAHDAPGARAALAAWTPDVLLLDVQLPGEDGLALTRILRAEPATREIPIAIVTAYASAADEERAYAAGADAYVRKPIDTREIVRLVETLAAEGAAVRGTDA